MMAHYTNDDRKKSASSPDEAALLGKKYHIDAKIRLGNEPYKFFGHFLNSITGNGEKIMGFGWQCGEGSLKNVNN